MKLPQPWKSIGGLRRHFLDGFPPLFEKADAKNALAFSQFQQVRRRLTFTRDHFLFLGLTIGVHPRCEGSLEIEGGPVRNPVTGTESRPGVVLPEGIFFKAADLGASVRFRVMRDVQYDHSGKHISISAFDYSGRSR